MRLAVLATFALIALTAAAAAIIAVRELRGTDALDATSTGAYIGSEPPVEVRLPAFRLRDEAGRRVSSDAVRDDVVLVTFLDTQCTEACPIIASHIGRALDSLAPRERRAVTALAITVDPEEDTPANIRAFLRRYRAHGKLTYLTGSERELRRVWRAFRVLPSVETGSDDMHSAPVRVFDERGRWVSTLHAGVDLTPENLAHDARVALRTRAA